MWNYATASFLWGSYGLIRFSITVKTIIKGFLRNSFVFSDNLKLDHGKIGLFTLHTHTHIHTHTYVFYYIIRIVFIVWKISKCSLKALDFSFSKIRLFRNSPWWKFISPPRYIYDQEKWNYYVLFTQEIKTSIVDFTFFIKGSFVHIIT